MRRPLIAALLVVAMVQIVSAEAEISDETQECLMCHERYTPGIVRDWESGRHSMITPAQALLKSEMERRISREDVPEEMASVAVGCYECHSLNKTNHPDNFGHFGFDINLVVTPDDCQMCHLTEAEQYAETKKANAFLILHENPLFTDLVNALVSVIDFNGADLVPLEPAMNAKNETCYACHGTKVEVKGTEIIETDIGDVVVPTLSNWPNQGVGRINPDGSKGSCTACHPRHSFDIEIARKPYTCSQCHLEPDVPAWQVYRESKHGNIMQSRAEEWNWSNVPWTIGTDFQAPTCAVCHNSLIVNATGDEVLPRTHDFGARLWVRIFGVIYSHRQPKQGRTWEIENQMGQPMPTTFDNQHAEAFLIGRDIAREREEEMKSLCRNCHGPSWADGFFVKFDSTVAQADQMVLSATELLQKAWNEKLADPKDPFDESIELKWVTQWLFYANSLRYASAMAGPDYATFKNGWWDLTKNLRSMQESIEIKAALKE